jgi:hypothetical protein
LKKTELDALDKEELGKLFFGRRKTNGITNRRQLMSKTFSREENEEKS